MWYFIKNGLIRESVGDFDWVGSDFDWDEGLLISMLDNCNNIKIGHFNVDWDDFYYYRGNPLESTLTRCLDLWKKIESDSNDDDFPDYNDGSIGLILGSSYNEDINNPTVYGLEMVFYNPRTVINFFNASSGGELWFLFDENGEPRYDLIPKKYSNIIKDKFMKEKNNNLNESSDGESNDFDWVKDIPMTLIPGEAYDIKTGNDYYWSPEVFVGEEYSDDFGGNAYVFRDLDRSSGSHRMSDKYANELIANGKIRPYDPNWSILDDIVFSDDIEDVLKGGFVIYFKDGVYLDDTLELQDRLFEMGFSFYSKGQNEYIKNISSGKKIQFFECFNWDTSKPQYSRMPNNQRDLKKILLREYGVGDMGLRTPNKRMEDQMLFKEVVDHNAIVINGDRYVRNDINESKKKPINEIAGISFEVREWSKIISDEIKKNKKEKTRIIIDGHDHPETFKTFSIDFVIIDFYDRFTGYNDELSGYDKDGNYIVVLYIQPMFRNSGSLISVLNHEMKHAWEDYNRISKGLPGINKSKEVKELYNKDFVNLLSDNNIRGPIKDILKYYYFLSQLEVGAYMENVYDGYAEYEKIVREVASKDFESLKDRFDLDADWHLMTTQYNIPFLMKFKNPIDFINHSSKELRSKAVKMIKKMNKMKYVHGLKNG